MVDLTDEVVGDFFKEIIHPCSRCSAPINLWDVVRKSFDDEIGPFEVFGIVGAQTWVSDLTVFRNMADKVNLKELGLPPKAKILHVDLWPMDLDIHPFLAPQMFNDVAPEELYFFTRDVPNMPSDLRTTGETGSARLVITWVETSTENFALMNLVQALELFTMKRYIETIVPSNVVIEPKMKSVMKKVFNRYAESDGVGTMFKGTNNLVANATMFSVIMPVAAELVKFPKLVEPIPTILKDLNANRNEVAHEGRAKKEFLKDPKKLAADFICATFFTMAYLRLMEQHVDGLNDRK